MNPEFSDSIATHRCHIYSLLLVMFYVSGLSPFSTSKGILKLDSDRSFFSRIHIPQYRISLLSNFDLCYFSLTWKDTVCVDNERTECGQENLRQCSVSDSALVPPLTLLIPLISTALVYWFQHPSPIHTAATAALTNFVWYLQAQHSMISLHCFTLCL